jgi:hypothetical protein
MLGDIGYPQLIRRVPMELSLDAVTGSGDARDMTITRTSRNAVDARSAHQQLDRQVTDDEALSEDRVGMPVDGPVRCTSKTTAGTSRIMSVSQAWRIARAEGARKRRA